MTRKQIKLLRALGVDFASVERHFTIINPRRLIRQGLPSLQRMGASITPEWARAPEYFCPMCGRKTFFKGLCNNCIDETIQNNPEVEVNPDQKIKFMTLRR